MLADKHCKNATCPPDKKRARFTDSGALYLEVSPAGPARKLEKLKAGRADSGTFKTVALEGYAKQAPQCGAQATLSAHCVDWSATCWHPAQA